MCTYLVGSSQNASDAGGLLDAPSPAEVDITLPGAGEVQQHFGVLIVEDERLVRNALELVFQRRGFQVWVAADGGEGVELYQKFASQIDIVLSDVQMPVLEGPRMLEVLRQINPHVRLCFMTGDFRQKRCAELLRCGALKVFHKPFPSLLEVANEVWRLASSEEVFVSEKVESPDEDRPQFTVVEASLKSSDVNGFLRSFFAPLGRAMSWMKVPRMDERSQKSEPAHRPKS